MKTPENKTAKGNSAFGPWYSLIRPASGWNATGPTPNRALVKSDSFQVVKRAFDKMDGPARIIDESGGIIESKLA